MYYIVEKYESDTQGITIRNINDWFSETAFAEAINHLEFKTFTDASKVLSALEIIFNSRTKNSQLIIITEAKD
tara:strand:- start:67 stop:285 length:219 start_codon:yes stop_codon:yes gene_type:complete